MFSAYISAIIVGQNHQCHLINPQSNIKQHNDSILYYRYVSGWYSNTSKESIHLNISDQSYVLHLDHDDHDQVLPLLLHGCRHPLC